MISRSIFSARLIFTAVLGVSQPVSSLASPAPTTTAFACAFAGTDNTTSQDIFDCSNGSNVVADRTNGTSIAKGRANLGSLGYRYTSPNADRAFSGGMWSDQFTITGLTGTGIAKVSLEMHGTFAGNAVSFSTIWYSLAPISTDSVKDVLNGNSTAPPNSITIIGDQIMNGANDSNRLLQGSFEFQFNQPFYLLALFGGGGGNADFYNSQTFGLTTQFGSAYSTNSGVTYASAVPDAQTSALFLVGLILIAITRRCAPK
jgi:hypothetical protein